MTTTVSHLLGPWRRTFQWSTTLVLLVIPFIRLDGASLVRLDLATLSLHLFGSTLHIEQLYLFLLLCISLILLFLLVTLVLGRAWCGWACPQTTLSDLAEGLIRRLGLHLEDGRVRGPLSRRLLLQLGFGLIALLFAANLVWYFVSPYSFFAELWAGSLHPGVLATLLGTALCVYLDLALVRRLVCREFCPYGRFQTVLVDPGTLTLRFHPDEAERCIRCGACVRACPMGIDIRRGYQVECINCGRCLDACREVMARRGQPGIIRYTFGLESRGLRALLNPRILLVSLAFLAVSSGLVVATVNRPAASVKLARSALAQPRILADGRQAVFFTAVVGNRSQHPLTASLLARDASGANLELRGPVTAIRLQPDERRTVDFALLVPVVDNRQTIKIILRDDRERPLASSRAYIDPLPRSSYDRSR